MNTTNVPLKPMPQDWERGLAIVAHPDDLEYGRAGAIAAWTSVGKQITYVVATRGEAGIDGLAPDECAPIREAEQRKSAAIVGVHVVEFLDHRDGVIEDGLLLRADIVAAIRRHRPELIITINHHDIWAMGAWNTPDHRIIGRAVLDAAASAGNRWIFPELQEDGLAPWDGVRWVAIAHSPRPSHSIDVTDTFDKAVESLVAHEAYIRGLTGKDPETYARKFLRRAYGLAESDPSARATIPFELFPLINPRG